MNNITFLVADEPMKTAIEHTLWTYRDSFPHQGSTPPIVIIDFPNLVHQARELIRQGAEVLITNSGSHQILSAAIDDVPILCLYSSTNDALYTLRQIAGKYDKIHLLLNKHFMFNSNACPPDIQAKLVRYPPYSIDDTHYKLLEILDAIPATPHTAIVGCTLLPQVAPHLGMPVYPIRPSESTILSVYQYAHELITFQTKDKKQLSLLQSILSHVDEGIILYDIKGDISHINTQARRFLRVAHTARNIRDILPAKDIERLLEGTEKILTVPPYTLVAHASPFRLDKTKHYILTLRDVTELQRLEKNIRYKLAKTGLTATHHFADIKTQNERMQAVIATAKTIAAYNAPVLIQGESGTGKELFAQSIHNASPRRSGPFVVVNCAALPPELLESELFGYVGGSFTGARKEGKAGYFELAHNGTIFLDEINSMTPNIQSKLLRVLEAKEIMRIGSDSVISLDIRIISASNADILEAVQSSRFRRDLFFRLNTLTLNLPSLNERPDDIVYLFSLFYENVSSTKPHLSEALKKALEQHHWWGNIRELASVAMRYHIFGEQHDTTYSYLFDQGQHREASFVDPSTLHIDRKQLHQKVDELMIETLLNQGYTRNEVASILSVTRQTIFNKTRSLTDK